MSLLAVELWVGHNAARLHQFGAVLSPVLLPRRAGKAKATTPPAERPTASKATPPTTLEVVVLDPRGEPVSGAVVAVSTGREAMPRPHSGRTGTRGSVKLAVLFTKTYGRVLAPGLALFDLALATAPPASPSKGPVLTRPGGRLRQAFGDEDDGQGRGVQETA